MSRRISKRVQRNLATLLTLDLLKDYLNEKHTL